MKHKKVREFAGEGVTMQHHKVDGLIVSNGQYFRLKNRVV